MNYLSGLGILCLFLFAFKHYPHCRLGISWKDNLKLIPVFTSLAETHRTVLNQILRQSTTPLADGPFSVLVDHTRILDFDVKRRYFRQELERLDEGLRREDLPVHVRRENVFEDSFRELFRRSPEEWKQRFYIVFEGRNTGPERIFRAAIASCLMTKKP